MLLIVGTVRIPAENLEIARPIMQQMIAASRAEQGCEAYHYAQDVLEPGLIHVKEIWCDQQALDRHFASAHIAVWRAAWPALQISDRDLQLYDIGPPRAT